MIIYYTEAEYRALEERCEALQGALDRQHITHIDPVAVHNHVTETALKQLWALLNVDNQTQAVQKLKTVYLCKGN